MNFYFIFILGKLKCSLTFQTGSGKTFTITGGAERYIDRGIIPRTLSYIFEYFEKVGTIARVALRDTLAKELSSPKDLFCVV